MEYLHCSQGKNVVKNTTTSDKLATLSQSLAVFFTVTFSSVRGEKLILKRKKTLKSPELTHYKDWAGLIITLNTNPTTINSFQTQLNPTEVAVNLLKQTFGAKSDFCILMFLLLSCTPPCYPCP